jgi:hypothetical protein
MRKSCHDCRQTRVTGNNRKPVVRTHVPVSAPDLKDMGGGGGGVKGPGDWGAGGYTVAWMTMNIVMSTLYGYAECDYQSGLTSQLSKKKTYYAAFGYLDPVVGSESDGSVQSSL